MLRRATQALHLLASTYACPGQLAGSGFLPMIPDSCHSLHPSTVLWKMIPLPDFPPSPCWMNGYPSFKIQLKCHHLCCEVPDSPWVISLCPWKSNAHHTVFWLHLSAFLIKCKLKLWSTEAFTESVWCARLHAKPWRGRKECLRNTFISTAYSVLEKKS